jgi:hypothetical protein
LEFITDANTSFAKINRDLSRLSTWSAKWLVTFNATKTKYVIFSRKKIKPLYPQLYLNDEVLVQATSHSHLGVTLSCDLSWQAHINNITKKSHKRLGIIRKLRWLFPRITLITLYKTLIRPILDYADILYDNCTIKHTALLEKVQRQAAILCTGAYKLTSHDKLLNELGWEHLTTRRKFHRLTMLYKIVNNLTPSYLSTIKPLHVSDITTYRLRNATHFVLPRCHTSTYQNCFIYRTIIDWNKLDLHTVTSKSLNTFKHQIKVKYIPVVNALYSHGSCKSQTHLCRMRLGLSGLNQQLFTYNITDSYSCQYCTNTRETPKHFLLTCPKYVAQRDRMLLAVFRTICPRVKYSLLLPSCLEYLVNVLLKGSEDLTLQENQAIYNAVFLYIDATERF